MRLFAKRGAAPTLFERSRDYALRIGAPVLIAEVFAEEVERRDDAGAFGHLKASPVVEWAPFAAESLGSCPHCGSPWAIFVPCTSAWECWSCDGPAWPSDPEAEAV